MCNVVSNFFFFFTSFIREKIPIVYITAFFFCFSNSNNFFVVVVVDKIATTLLAQSASPFLYSAKIWFLSCALDSTLKIAADETIAFYFDITAIIARVKLKYIYYTCIYICIYFGSLTLLRAYTSVQLL